MNEAKIIAILMHPSSNLDKHKEGKIIIELCACFQNSQKVLSFYCKKNF